MPKPIVDTGDAFKKAIDAHMDDIRKTQERIAKEVERLKADRRVEPILNRIMLDVVGGEKYGHLIDSTTGRPIQCRKFEIIHEAGKRPEMIIYVTPEMLEYNMRSMDAGVVIEGSENESAEQ